MKEPTHADVFRMLCQRFEEGQKIFQIVLGNSPSSNLFFNSMETEITFTQYPKDQDAEVIEIEHRRISKVYQLYFRTTTERKEFSAFFHDLLDLSIKW